MVVGPDVKRIPRSLYPPFLSRMALRVFLKNGDITVLRVVGTHIELVQWFEARTGDFTIDDVRLVLGVGLGWKAAGAVLRCDGTDAEYNAAVEILTGLHHAAERWGVGYA